METQQLLSTHPDITEQQLRGYTTHTHHTQTHTPHTLKISGCSLNQLWGIRLHFHVSFNKFTSQNKDVSFTQLLSHKSEVFLHVCVFIFPYFKPPLLYISVGYEQLLTLLYLSKDSSTLQAKQRSHGSFIQQQLIHRAGCLFYSCCG